MSAIAKSVWLDAVQAPSSFTGSRHTVRLAAVVRDWRARVRFRQQLWRLLRDKPKLIEDIGLTIAEAREEIARPFWRPSMRFSRSRPSR